MSGRGDELLLLRASSGVVDQSSNGNDGVFGGGMGVSGGEFVFGGSPQKISCPYIALGSAFTVSCWFKQTVDAGSASYLIAQDTGSTRNFILRTLTSGSFVGLSLIVWDTSGVAYTAQVLNLNYLADGLLHLVTGVSDGTNLILYYDGVAVATVGGTSSPRSLSTATTIGVKVSSNYFLGSMRDIRLFGSALSSSDVWTIYNGGSPGYDLGSSSAGGSGSAASVNGSILRRRYRHRALRATLRGSVDS